MWSRRGLLETDENPRHRHRGVEPQVAGKDGDSGRANLKPSLCRLRRDQLAVMGEDDVRRIARFQCHPRRVVQDGEPIGDVRMPQAVFDPSEALA